MRLATKGRLALSAMIDLGLHQDRGPVTLASIGLRQRISVSYLEQLFARLRHHELVESTRGPGGGYRLVRPVVSISVADIISAVDGPLGPTGGGERENRGSDRLWATQELWTNLNQQMVGFLGSVSLGDLVEQQGERKSRIAAPDSMSYRAAEASSSAR